MTGRPPAPLGSEVGAATERAPRGLGARLAGDSLVYGLGGIANQAVAVLLVPIYARQLGSEGVGVAGVLNSAVSLSLMIAGLALPSAFFRWYLREADDLSQRRHVLGVVVAIRTAASLLGFALVLASALPLTAALYGGDHLIVFALAAPIVLFDSFNQVPLSFLRAERRARDYVLVSLSRAVVGTVMILALVVLLRVGVVGVAIGSAVAAALSAAIGIVSLWRVGALRFSIDRDLMRQMLGFSLPLVPAAIAGWVLNLSDRPLLQVITGSAATVGVYSLGYTAGLVTNALVVQPFSLAWGAAHWEISRASDAPQAFARVMTWFLAFASGVALLVAGMGTDALRLLAGPEFEGSRYIVPFSAFAYVMFGAYTIGSSGLSIVGRTGLVAGAMGVAAISSVVLNLVLIPILGMFGAAISTILGYLVLALLTGGISYRHYPVPWQLGRGASAVGIAVGLSAAALVGPDHTLWRIGCVIVYPLMIVGLRIVSMDDVRGMLSLRTRR